VEENGGLVIASNAHAAHQYDDKQTSSAEDRYETLFPVVIGVTQNGRNRRPCITDGKQASSCYELMKDSTQLIHMKRISPSSVHWRRITKTHSSSRWNAISGFSAMSGIKCGAGSAVADLMVPPDGGRRITPQNDFESASFADRSVHCCDQTKVHVQTTKTSIQDSTE